VAHNTLFKAGVAHNTLFKAGRVVWCGAVGYASGLRDVARVSSLSSINQCVASSWFFALHIVDDARSNTHQIKSLQTYGKSALTQATTCDTTDVT